MGVFKGWGGNQGPIIQGNVILVGAAPAVQIFDSSTSARTPQPNAKTMVFINRQGAAGNILIGGVTTDNTNLTMEIKPGDPPAVFDFLPQTFSKWYAYAPVGVTLYFSQLG